MPLGNQVLGLRGVSESVNLFNVYALYSEMNFYLISYKRTIMSVSKVEITHYIEKQTDSIITGALTFRVVISFRCLQLV